MESGGEWSGDNRDRWAAAGHTREAEHTEGSDHTARDAAQYIHSYTRDRETNTLLITLNRYYLHRQ